eukprot:TRINITY_DN166_c0_g1_i1.p1 TRINITY_DN166_c0_g1~~TRINITY_DN166_c0_g1_i1.p1  ORF type:complete len:598 (+),score=179.58 TRINITY_DN166_c0_g1_i1:904-2697(+)
MALNLGVVREYHKGQVLEVFKGNKKYVVCLDGDLEGLMRDTMETDDILDALPDNVVKMHSTDDPLFGYDAKDKARVVFIIQSRLPVLKKTVKHVKNLAEKYKVPARDIRILLVPRRTLIAEHVFTVEGIKDCVGDVAELDIDLAVVDDNVMSMELDKAGEELLVDSERSVLYSIAKSIVKLMMIFGKIENIKWKGVYSDLVGKLIDQMTMEASDLLAGQSTGFHTLLLVDRMTDLTTPMVVEGTYRGILQEIFPITNNTLHPPIEILVDGQPLKEVKLNQKDPIYKALRDVGLNGIQQRLHRRAVSAQDKEDKRKELKNPTELKAFFDNLPALMQEKKCLSIHLDLYAELRKKVTSSEFRNNLDYQKQILKGEIDKEVTDAIEIMMYKEEEVPDVMRLVCLYSQCVGGLKGKLYDQWKAIMVQIYGLRMLGYWEKLERARVLVKAETGKVNLYAGLRKNLELFDANFTSSSVHSVYHGYAPIIPKLIHRIVTAPDWNRSWTALKPTLALLPGPTYPDDDVPRPPDIHEKNKTRNVLVFFIGGITHSEIAALRVLEDDLASDEDVPPLRFIIATTSIITGRAFISSLTGYKQEHCSEG